MKVPRLILAAGLIAALAGCDQSGTLQARLDQASRIGDPYEAAQYLDMTYEGKYRNACAILIGCSDQELELNREIESTKQSLMIKAVERADIRAISKIFDEYSPPKVRAQAAPIVMALAQHPDADKDILRIAGTLAFEGKFAQADYVKALDYFARSWRLGSNQAADGAKTLFAKIEDNDNAYLWSLRCMNDCAWDNSKIIKTPNAQRVIEIQRLALDKSILVIGESPFKSIKG